MHRTESGDHIDAVRDTLQAGSIGVKSRRSRQREVILEELRKLKTHPRSDELYALVRQRLPNVSLGTVYRNLDKLQREGAVLEIYCGDFVRYDGDVASHDHFMCRVCRRVWDFGGRGESQGVRGYAAEGFQVEASYTVFTGLCPECGERGGSEETQTRGRGEATFGN